MPQIKNKHAHKNIIIRNLLYTIYMYINSMWVILKINKVDYRAQTIRRAANSKENKYIYISVYIVQKRYPNKYIHKSSLYIYIIYKIHVVYACKQLSLSIPRMYNMSVPATTTTCFANRGGGAVCIWIKIRRRSYPRMHYPSRRKRSQVRVVPSLIVRQHRRKIHLLHERLVFDRSAKETVQRTNKQKNTKEKKINILLHIYCEKS